VKKKVAIKSVVDLGI